MSKVKPLFGEQTGMFPGVFDSEGVQPPRLEIVITIDVKDTYTDEKCTRKIPLKFDKSADAEKHMENAITHRRTLNDIASFCEGRDGEELKTKGKGKRNEED